MIITQETFTTEALRFVEPDKAYDREYLARDVAKSLADKLYEELGRTKAMSLLDVEHLQKAFYTCAMSLIDWTACNRKQSPREYADEAWRQGRSEEMINGYF